MTALFHLHPVAAEAPASPWTRLSLNELPHFDAHTLPTRWDALHAGHPAPAPPAGSTLAEGWAHYHAGEFERACAIGLAEGDEGLWLANQAAAVYANYVEPHEAPRLALLRQVAERAHARAQARPDDAQALYWEAYALGRYGQGISVARALAQGLGGRIKSVLERLVALRPDHADAHIALGAFHAELVDKVGPLVARMTYGVSAEAALGLFERGLALHPRSPTALLEYARALLALHGDSRLAEATALYRRAAQIEPLDARECLDVALARAELRD